MLASAAPTAAIARTQQISNFTYTYPNSTAVYANNVVLNPGTMTIDVAATAAGSAVTMGTLTVNSGGTATLNVTASTAPTGQTYGLTLGATTLNSDLAINISNNTNGGGNALGTLTLGPVTDNNAGYGITKIGPGTLLLPAANTYSGPTAIDQGLVNLTGSLGNTAVAIGGGTLTGSGNGTSTGVIGGGITLNSGSIDFSQDGQSSATNLAAASLAINGGSLTFNLFSSAADLITLGTVGNVTGGVVGHGRNDQHHWARHRTGGTYNLVAFSSYTGLTVGAGGNLTLGTTPSALTPATPSNSPAAQARQETCRSS